jgi:hypothetical protein
MPTIQIISIPIGAMIVLLGMAIGGTLFMSFSGHDHILLSVSLSLFWMFVSYVLSYTGVISDDTRNIMIRAAIACLSLSLITGSIIFSRIRKHS